MSRLRSLMIFAALGLAAVTFAAVALLTDSTGATGDAPPPLDGCHEVVTQELYVQHAYACDDGSRVVVFTDGRARDDYLKTAEYFGSVTLERGPRWARVR